MVALQSVTNLLKPADEYGTLKAALLSNHAEAKELIAAIQEAGNEAFERGAE